MRQVLEAAGWGPKEWHLPDEDVFGSESRRVVEAGAEANCGGFLASFEQAQSPAVARRLTEELGSSKEATFRVELAFYRFEATERSFREAFCVSTFVDDGPGLAAIAGRGKEDEAFDACAMEPEVAARLLEDVKPRATATIEGETYELGDYSIRLGTFRQGSSSRAAVVAVRYRPLRPGHPAAEEAERRLAEDTLGLAAYSRHKPLKLKSERPGPPAEPFFDVDHHLGLVNCCRSILYGSGDTETK